MKSFYTVTIFFIICLCCLDSVLGQAPRRLSLAECVATAIQNNPSLGRSSLALSRNDIAHKQAQYRRLPSLNGNINHDYNEGRSVNSTTNQFVESSYFSGSQSLSLNVPLFSSFRILHDVRKRASAKEAGKLEFEGAINELKLDVITAYVLQLTSQDMLAQTEGQLAVTQENLRRAGVLHKQGAINPGDYYDLEGQAQSELNDLENAKQALYMSKLRLASLLAISVDELPEIVPLAKPTAELGLSRAELYTEALGQLPTFKALDWRIKESESAIKQAKAEYFPSLALTAGIQSRFSSVDVAGYNYWQQLKNYPSKGVSLSLRVPIFNQLNVRTGVKLAKLDLEEAIWNRKVAENLLLEETAKAVFNLGLLQRNVSNLQQQEHSYEEAFRIAQVHFDTGNSNSVLFLTAKNKLDKTKNQLLVKQYEWVLQKYINDYYAGKLDL